MSTQNPLQFITWLLALLPTPREVFLPSYIRLSDTITWEGTHATHEGHPLYTLRFQAPGVDFSCQFWPTLMKFKFPEDAKETLGPGGFYRLETALNAILFHHKKHILETHGMKLIPKKDVEKRLHKAYLEQDLATIEQIKSFENFLET